MAPFLSTALYPIMRCLYQSDSLRDQLIAQNKFVGNQP